MQAIFFYGDTSSVKDGLVYLVPILLLQSAFLGEEKLLSLMLKRSYKF